MPTEEVAERALSQPLSFHASTIVNWIYVFRTGCLRRKSNGMIHVDPREIWDNCSLESRCEPIKDLKLNWYKEDVYPGERVSRLFPRWTETAGKTKNYQFGHISYAQPELPRALLKNGILMSIGSVAQFKVLHRYDPHDNTPGLRFYILLRDTVGARGTGRDCGVYEKLGHRTIVTSRSGFRAGLEVMPNGTDPRYVYAPCDGGIARAFRLTGHGSLRYHRDRFIELQLHQLHFLPGFDGGEYQHHAPTS